eukprot:3031366-Karenia_brevis.AAC.1
MDIKDFYLCDNHEDIVQSFRRCIDHLDDTLQTKVCKILAFCLDNQYVTSKLINMFKGDISVYKVAEGSGMGVLASGELSDWHYYVKAE